MREFRYPRLWLFVGWFGIVLLIYLSLATLSVDSGIDHGDKLGHLLAYALLMGWFVQLFRGWHTILRYAVALIALGIGLEFLQQLTGRYFEYADMLANTLGVCLGMLTALTPLRDRLLRLEKYLLR